MRGSGTLATYLAQNQTITSSTKAIAELNQNRYVTLNAVSDAIYNAGDLTEYFKSKFTFADAALPNRPHSGAPIVRYGRYPGVPVQRAWSMNNIENTSTYNSAGYWVPGARLYMAQTNPQYKYFTSQSTTGTFGLTYTSGVWANKVAVTIENTLEWPVTWTIQVKISGSWVTVATNPVVDPGTNKKGQVFAYRVAGSWTTTEPASPSLTDAVLVEGIQVVITAMSTTLAHPNIIELSPRLQADVSEYLQDWSWDENLSEQSLVAPVGLVSSSSGNITFSNSGQDWEPRITSGSPRLSDLAKKHCIVRIYETMNGETLKMATAYCEDWKITEGTTASAPLFDKATLAQAAPCSDLLMRDVTPTAAIIRVLDHAGLSGIKLRRVTGEKEISLPFFFCSKDQTVWDAIQALCESHQYAVWVDADGDFNIATRNWIYGRGADAAAWTFKADTSLPDYADIISHEEEASEPVNSVLINFKEQLQSRSVTASTSTAISGLGTGLVGTTAFATRNLWDSNRRAVLLGCTNLAASITDVATTIRVNVNTFRDDMWDMPVGYAYMDTEVIKLGAARFGYINSSDTYVTADIETLEDYKLMMAEAKGNVTFTGLFVNCERGAFGTTPTAHFQALTDWHRVSADSRYASLVQNSAGNSFVRLYKSTAPVDYKMSMYKDLAAPYGRFYTRIVIPKQSTPQRAGGMVVWATTASDALAGGWYFELRSSAKQKNELAIVQIKNTGVLNRATQLTYNVPITEGVAYDLTVFVTPSSQKGRTRFRVFVNEHLIADAHLANSLVPKTSKVALMATGRSVVQFDFFAAANKAKDEDTYTAGVSSIIKNMFAQRKSLVQGVVMAYESFDNKLRGIYVEDVRFNNGPALTAKMYAVMNIPQSDKTQTGIWIAKSTDIAAALDDITPFSAKIAVGNVAQHPVTLDDGSTIYPYMFGSIVESSPVVQITAKDEDAIRKFGEKKFEFSPEWIVTRKAAQSLADWIVSVKGSGMNTHTIESFDNPLVEIGDMVSISYPRKNLTTTEKFVVYGVSRSRQVGLATSVQLVKVA